MSSLVLGLNTNALKKTFALAFALVILAGCQQKLNKKQSLRNGRGLRGSTQVDSATVTVQQCGSYSVAGKTWGEVTMLSNQTSFQAAVQQLTAPVLSQLPAEDQLGFVSGSSNQYTGVRFWGNVKVLAGGTIDASSAEIRIEIYDDRACQPKADGTVRPNIPIHIGAGLPQFVSAGGSVTSGGSNLIFTDSFGSIILSGTIVNNMYTGTMSYTLTSTGGAQIQLGRFSVRADTFFAH